jgi:Predicted deacetylase
MRKVIIRLDDISWDMNFDKFDRIREILCRYQVSPIIGVIPENRDQKLAEYRNESDHETGIDEFWELMRELQDKDGWEIALHGCYHVYTTDEPGIMDINKRSEFAGLSYEKQRELIKKGRTVLERNGLKPIAFMAPAHSFDYTTIKALEDNGIYNITDGLAVYPYKQKGCVFVPQTGVQLKVEGLGYSTICIHVNEWSDDRFEKLDQFLSTHRDCIISYSEALRDYKEGNRIYWRAINLFYYIYFISRRRLSRIKHRFV